MNRIDAKFAELRRTKKKAFIAFITAGDPSLAVTEKLVPVLEEAGADIVELGIPFSDPLADGPTIQASYQRALAKGTTLTQILQTVKKIRRHSQVPIALMSSFNPIFCFGEEKFIRAAKDAGVDGVIVPDLPVEEAATLIRSARRYDLSTVFFVAPTTTSDRIKPIAQASTGFIYYVSLTGVTGARTVLPSDLVAKIRATKKITKKPICVGFGISTRAQVKAVQKIADGVIVGSAIVKQIEKLHGQKNVVQSIQRFVHQLSQS